MEPLARTRIIFVVSVAATVLGLVIIFEPAALAGWIDWLGWNDLDYASVYVRGFALVCAGCWFGERSWRELVTAKPARRDEPDPEPESD